jgi:uncharacterized protein YjbI with pentapeptide repeats
VRYRVLSPRTIAAWAVLIMLVGVGVAVWLLLAYTGGDADTNRVQLDAIRTAGTIVVGTGGATALLLAARRQRSTEIALKQKDRDQADTDRAHALQEQIAEQTRRHQERVAAATEADAAARRITDLYTKAADQLGSDKAPVRLAGLYALERLAQDNPSQRQTIVNVLCAYLRMSYTLPGNPPADDADDKLLIAHREGSQEREVRLAAQRILAQHLRPGDSDEPVETFWADIDLDLTGATLIDLDLTGCHARTTTFTHAHFTGPALFNECRFTSAASFNKAQFTDIASFRNTQIAVALFDKAQFADASFVKARFTGGASFNEAQFTSDTWFNEAFFTSDASFREARFTGDVLFDNAQFTHVASFRNTQFAVASFREVQSNGAALFDMARFTNIASFDKARFTNIASFDKAQFINKVPFVVAASFDKAQFTSDTWFRETRFTGEASFRETEFTRGASFREAQFTGEASFRETRFTGEASFRETQFTHVATFDKAQFTHVAIFDKAQFTEFASFRKTEFAVTVPPEAAPFWSPPVTSASQQEESDTD